MKEKMRVGIIGHFGAGLKLTDGQTIKTRVLERELETATNWKLVKVDTYYRKNPVKLWWDAMVCLCSCKDIFVLLSGNGMRMLFPVLYLFAKVFKKNIYHDVIGSQLDRYVIQYPAFKSYLNSFRVNWVETGSMKEALEAVGVTNAIVMPNFKRLNVADLDSLPTTFAEPYRFCTFSRVMKEKGIEEAAAAVEAINTKAGRCVCTLDIYGKVDEAYTQRFEELMAHASSAVQYRGMVPFDKSVEAIRDYYALLFPTYWKGEGFAGTIIDAFSAGLPVIATDWNCNREVVENMVNGILYPNEEIKDLESAITWTIENPEQVTLMRKACINRAQQYQPDRHIPVMVQFVEAQR